MLRRIHHVDFVVEDLDQAVNRFTRVFGRSPEPAESLEHRGVRLARFDLDGVWVILVQPVSPDSPVRAFLDSHGQGFFHMGFLVDDLSAEVERLQSEGIELESAEPRSGLDDWRLIDVALSETLGAMIQLVEEGGREVEEGG